MKMLNPGAHWLPVLLCGIIWGWAVDGAPVTGGMTVKGGRSKDDFSRSLRLSRKLLQETRSLAHDYRSWKLPGSHLDLIGHSENIPSVSISFHSWLKLLPGERLRLLNGALRVFPVYLEELEKWVREDTSDKASHLKEKVTKVRLYLRDLLHHIQKQMSSQGVSVPAASLSPHGPPTSGKHWCSRVLMFQALQTLEQSLLRAVRDYTVLQSSLD